MPASLTFEFGFAAPDPQQAAAEGLAMRILVMGDFSGRAAAQGLGAPRRVDLDNFDQVLAQLAPGVQVTLDDGVHALSFGELEDFHPDRLYQKTDAFRVLRAQRQSLRNPATFPAAAAALRQPETPAAASPAAAPAAPPALTSAPPASDGGTQSDFASLLGGQVRQASAAGAAAGAVPPVDQLIRSLVGTMPAGADPRQAEYLAAADTVIGQRMRAVLHAPAFQALEALWRGLHQLVTGIELGEDLQLYILDAAKETLQADVAQSLQGGGLGTSALHKVLVDQPRRGADPAPWSVLCGAYTFGPGADDIALLAALGALAQQAQAPFLANAGDALLGTASLAAQADHTAWQPLDAEAEQRWQALRTSPHAGWLGLALPRVLLRLPYGKATDSIEQFGFEEADAGHAHEDYLWGHASLACALLLGRAFESSEWDMSPGDELDIGDLPAHTVRRDGEAHMQACAETLLSERAGDAILQRGPMPLLSFKSRNAVRLLRSQSLADPARALSGPWNQ